MKYRGHTITKNSAGNYRVKSPTDGLWAEHAVNLKTAKKWVDCALYRIGQKGKGKLLPVGADAVINKCWDP